MSRRKRDVKRRGYRAVGRETVRTVATLVVGSVVIAVFSIWHRLLGVLRSSPGPGSQQRDGSQGPELVEYELGWYRYLKAFDAHHGPTGSPDRDPASGSFLRGLRTWLATRCLRGYTLGDEVYVCPNAPRVLRVHQAGHAPSFGSEFPTLVRSRRDSGGLDDAPLSTLDVMLPGDFPHTLLRLRDTRGLTDTYEEWLDTGRIERVNR
ncbi:hypothetical protein ACFR9U_01600 [Halorientalis brevis]|uniref:Uncharacterized protein n=1 Tax=Halorientalis brevis TaxID=1126241 RepID=A0ABD6C7J1_9EURY|nr:hypothetical protein [Halorientalis brevis]